jgi:SAM-dependent methyltransferase
MPDDKGGSPLDAFRVKPGDAQEPDTNPGDTGEEATDEVDPSFYANGGISLSESEQQALGELQGRRVLALGAGNGEDICSLINLGATVTVIDDEETLAAARTLIEEAKLTAEFLPDDPASLSVDHRTGEFDIVYSCFGAIDWVDDISAWAGGVYDALKPGGRLVAYDEHPLAYVFDNAGEQLVVANSYFGGAFGDITLDPDGDVEAQPEHEHDADDEELPNNGPTWTIGDIVSGLGANGLATLSLLEFPESDRYETQLDRLADAPFEVRERVPGAFLLVALKY